MWIETLLIAVGCALRTLHKQVPASGTAGVKISRSIEEICQPLRHTFEIPNFDTPRPFIAGILKNLD
jgi:hypothetical protein